MIETLRHDFVTYRELVKQLALRDLKSRYKVSVLGFFWSLLRPLLTIAVLAAVFSLVGIPSEIYDVPYWVVLTIAYVPWFYFSTAILEGTQSLVANAHLVKKVYSPRAVYPSAVVLSNLINFLLSLMVLVPLIYLLSDAELSLSLLMLPLVIGFHTLFLLGLCYLFATTNVLYRDTTQINEFLVFVWFYVSPVLYDMYIVRDRLAEKFQWLYLANPMVGIIEWYRYCLLSSLQLDHPWYEQTVMMKGIPYSAAVCVIVFFGGYVYLKKLETRAVDQL